MKVKTFLKALSYFPHDLVTFEKFLNDRRLTQAEKEILRCWLLLRDGDYQQLIAKLESISTTDNFVESQKFFLLGTAYINAGESHKGISPLNNAIKLLTKDEAPEALFACHFHLFMAYCNLKDIQKMSAMLDQLVCLNPKGTKEKMNLFRAQFNYYAYLGENTKARLYLKKIDALSKHMNEGQRIFFLTDKFDFYIKCDDFNSCEKVLSEMKTNRKFQLTSNYKFMRKLMDFYFHLKPLYLYPQDFQEKSILYHQVKFLLSYECGDVASAIQEWEYLRNLSPKIYNKDFEYAGDKCLFQLVLNKIKQDQTSRTIEIPETKGIEKKCLDALKSGKPFSQEDLFFIIWNKTHNSKEELTRLRMLISRLRSKYSLAITSKKGTYLLESDRTNKKTA